MITEHVPAVRLPPDHAGRRGAAAVAARRGVEDSGDPDAAPSACRPAAAAAAPPEAELGGPGSARNPARRDTESAPPGAAAADYPGHDRALAPRHRPPPPGRQVHARQDRPTSDPAEHSGSGPSAGPREPRLGIPQDPRRARRTRHKGRSVHRVGDPQGQRHRPSPAADRADLVTIPALPGRGDPGLRLLHSRPARRYTGLRPGRDRPRDPPHQHPRTHLASNLGMDRPAGPQPDHGSRRPGRRVKFMIRDRGSNFTTAFDAVLADAGIRTVLCSIQTPRMNAIIERWTSDADASSWTAPLSGTRPIYDRSCPSTRPTTISTGRTAPCTAPRR